MNKEGGGAKKHKKKKNINKVVYRISIVSQQLHYRRAIVLGWAAENKHITVGLTNTGCSDGGKSDGRACV